MAGQDPTLIAASEPTRRQLSSWKEIADYLGRGVRSVQRWEREEGLPVHRLAHQKRGSVYAYTDELDNWWKARYSSLAQEASTQDAVAEPPRLETGASVRIWWRVIFVSLLVIAGVSAILLRKGGIARGHALHQVTHLGNVWPSCAISSDGQTVAFTSDAGEEGNLDIWVQRIGSGQARRLTHNSAADIYPSLSPDGMKVLFASRRPNAGIYEIAYMADKKNS
jgi:hypothetical protein